MAKKQPVSPTPRQLRRQQQRATVEVKPLSQLQPSPPSELLGPSLLVPLFSATVVVGYLLFARGLATLPGNELSHHQSLFTAVNAATLTGFEQARNPDNYTTFGQLLTFTLMLAGILFSLICGGTAVIRIAGLRFKNWQLLAGAFAAVPIVAIGGGLSLMAERVGTVHRSFGQSAFQAVSAFGNSGLTLGHLSNAASVSTWLVLLPLSLLGGLGLPVLMDVFDRLRGRGELCIHTRTALTWTAGIYLVFTLLLLLLRWPGLTTSGSFWRSALVDASMQSINARSAGFAFQFVSMLPQEIAFALVLIMLIGASPAGTAGGLKVTTLAELFRGTRKVLQSQAPGRPFGLALTWTLIYGGMFLASTTALLITDPEIHLDRTLFLAASALGNVGLSYNAVDATTSGLYVLSATMMLGRIAPVMMLWYIVDTTPEAKVAVG